MIKVDKIDFLAYFLRQQEKEKKIFVAYSGGLDSHVLLHLLSKFCKDKSDIKLTAVHINHNISPNAKQWDIHCKQICEDLGVEYISMSVDPTVRTKEQSLEEILRKLRYEVFTQILPQNALLMTAHHANDQAETLLLQLFRGAGPKGLSSMPKKIEFSSGWLIRPLLNFSREDLLEYALEHNLKWIEDESNADIRFYRNFIRHNLMPEIKLKWPAIINTLNRVANHCAEASELLGVLAKQDLDAITVQEDYRVLDTEKLKELSLVRQKNVLRYWLSQLKLTTPSDVKLSEIVEGVLNSRYDAVPMVVWSGAEVRRFRNLLYAMLPIKQFDTGMVLRFDGDKLKLPADLGEIILKIDPESNYCCGKIEVRFRQGGEKLKLFNRKGTRDLKKLMQEWNIPPWLRDRTPLLYHDGEIIAVFGYYVVNGLSFKCS